MGTHNIRLYKKREEKYTGFNLKTKELLDCALIGVEYDMFILRNNI